MAAEPVENKSLAPVENKAVKPAEDKATKEDKPEFDPDNPYDCKEGYVSVEWTMYHEEDGKMIKPGKIAQLPKDRAEYLAHVGYVRIR